MIAKQSLSHSKAVTAPFAQGGLFGGAQHAPFGVHSEFRSLRKVPSLPCARGGGFCAAKLGGIVVYTADLQMIQIDSFTIPHPLCGSPLCTRGPFLGGARRSFFGGLRGALMGSFALPEAYQKQKAASSTEDTALELIGGFEPPTSSLPMTCSAS